jgi:hypothetical protein
MNSIKDIQRLTGFSLDDAQTVFCNMHYDNIECDQKVFEQEVYYTINRVLFWAHKLTDTQHNYFRSLK